MTRAIYPVFQILPCFIGRTFTIKDIREKMHDPDLDGSTLGALARQGYIRRVGQTMPDRCFVYEVTEVYPNEML